MILKKPYAFLIKNFKIIHLILLGIIIYVTYRFNKIVTFFNGYVTNSNIVSSGIVRNYVPAIIFIAVLIIILFSGLMWLLMYRKRKPNTFYLLAGLYYIVLLISIVYAYNVINSLSDTTLTQQVSRAYRDIYQILFFPNLYFMIISFIRGIGFDVKKFNFNKDLEELKIKNEDNEEFEFVLGNDSYKIKRRARRHLRELGYYIKENKIFIGIILFVVISLSALFIFLNTSIFNHQYKIGETLDTTYFSYVFKHAYISSYDYTGKKIKDDKKYLILDFDIKRNGSKDTIKPEQLYLFINNKSIDYKTSLSESFSDLGISYNNHKISNTYSSYIFIFELDSSINETNLNLKVFDKIKYNNDMVDYTYKTYIINPLNLDKYYKITEASIGETITLNETIFGSTSLAIKQLDIQNSYQYYSKNCDENGVCVSKNGVILPQNINKNVLLSISYDLGIDQNAYIYKTIKDNKKFLDKFLRIEYTLNNNTYKISSLSQTNDNIENMIFLDCPKSIQNIDSVYLNISTRTGIIKIKMS